MKAWISKMLSEEDGTPSTKRVLFTLAVIACLFFCAVDVIIKRNLEAGAIGLAQNVLFTAAAAYGVTRFAEK